MKWEDLPPTMPVSQDFCMRMYKNAFVNYKRLLERIGLSVDAVGELVWDKGEPWGGAGGLNSSISLGNFGKCDFYHLFLPSLVWGKKTTLFLTQNK